MLAVVLFHADESWVPAGFIGVDIFFTISGFLITGIVARGIGRGDFLLAAFYRNRIRRIAPVLWLVILTTLVAGQFMLLPADLMRLASSAIASGFFAANVYFTWFLDSGYFASDASLEPLLHLWSLGAEEQFYLFWPLLLLIGTRLLQPRGVLLATAAIAIASFVFGQYYYASDPKFVYYMLPARAGQLLAGALCFFIMRTTAAPSASIAAVLVCCGMVLIGYSLWALSPADVFPGFNAVPVSLGTALVLFGGAVRNPASAILGSSLLVGVGLLSYSVYLWHWPVLALLRYVVADPGTPLLLLAVAVTAVLSWLSYTFVETPCRANNAALGTIFWRYLVLPGALVTAIAASNIYTQGYGLHAWNEEYRRGVQQFSDTGRKAPSAAYVCQQSVITPQMLQSSNCLVGDGPTAPMAVWGDSNMSHYVGALRVLARGYGFSFRNFASGACPPLLEDPGAFTHAEARRRCNQFAELVADHLQAYEVVMISGNWEWYLGKYGQSFETALAASLRTLNNAGKRVIVLGMAAHLPGFDRDCEAKALKLPFLDCVSSASVPAPPVKALNQIIQRIAVDAGAEYLDFNRRLCRQGRCYGMIKGKTLYYDSLHLSARGSEQLGRWVLQADDHADFFRGLGQGRAPVAN